MAYKSLQSDSEAIACDVAGFLVTPETTGLSPNAPGTATSACTGSTGTSRTGVIILSSSGTTLANYQVWRMNMSLMRQLTIRAADFKCPSTDREKALGPAGLDAATEAVALVQSVLGLFASNSSTVGVQGTIGDQALMDGVSRQLRGLKIAVLMPDTYAPYTLGGLDFAKSPFLGALGTLMRCRVCLQSLLKDYQSNKAQSDDLTAKRKTAADTLKEDQDEVGKLTGDKLKAKDDEISRLTQEISEADVQIKALNQAVAQVPAGDVAGLLASIDAFLSSLTGGSGGGAANPQAGAQNPPPSGSSPPTGTGTNQPAGPPLGNGTANAPGNATPPIAAILAADGLAEQLGVKEDGALPSESIWQHILVLKALESGGSVLTHSNIFGGKVFFSGGSVATYSMFTLDGQLSCSGNVYDYGGFIRAEDFAGAFRKVDLDPRQQQIFVRGGCSSPDKNP
ncbi:MAG: hypothetical protein ACLP3K_13395 [Candidatus Acidiferrales bacterium]